jgi:hypothetical protein
MSFFPNYMETISILIIYTSWTACVTKSEIYIRVPPFTYSVTASATEPNMVNLPFHISASEVITPSDLDSALIPLNKGTRDAEDSRMLVARNHGIPPLAIWANTSENFVLTCQRRNTCQDTLQCCKNERIMLKLLAYFIIKCLETRSKEPCSSCLGFLEQ